MLSEKPWRAEAILRLVASVFVCVFMGTLVLPLIDFFSGPQKPGAVLVPAVALGAMVFLVVALIVLNRPWPFEKFPRNFLITSLCVYAGLMLTWWDVHLAGTPPKATDSTASILVTVLSF